MLRKHVNAVAALSPKKHFWRYISKFLGIILCGFLFASVAASEVPRISTATLGAVDEWVQHLQGKRDPFAPIKNPRAISSSHKKSHPDPPAITPVSTNNDPKFKLLGIISGQYEREAVIQVSPGERIFAKPGLELVHSGWRVKAISEGEVLLEHLSTSSSGKGLSQSRTFILSFLTPRKLR